MEGKLVTITSVSSLGVHWTGPIKNTLLNCDIFFGDIFGEQFMQLLRAFLVLQSQGWLLSTKIFRTEKFSQKVRKF
jgi:hypothetical protein